MYLVSISKQRTGMVQVAREVADIIVNDPHQIPSDPRFVWWLFEQSRRHGLNGAPIILLADRAGQITAGSAFGTEMEEIDWSGVSYGYDRIRFVKPVATGENVTVKYEIVEHDLAKERLRAEISITDGDGTLLSVGTHLSKGFVRQSAHE